MDRPYESIIFINDVPKVFPLTPWILPDSNYVIKIKKDPIRCLKILTIYNNLEKPDS